MGLFKADTKLFCRIRNYSNVIKKKLKKIERNAVKPKMGYR